MASTTATNPNDRKYSPSGNPLTAFVNLHQTPQERRDKYIFCRLANINPSWSRAMRDWRWSSIFEYLDNGIPKEVQYDPS